MAGEDREEAPRGTGPGWLLSSSPHWEEWIGSGKHSPRIHTLSVLSIHCPLSLFDSSTNAVRNPRAKILRENSHT